VRIEISPRARDDLIGIWEFVARESEESADRVFDQLVSLAESFALFPDRGHHHPSLRAPDLRVVSLREWLIVYRVRPMAVQIVRVVSGRQDLRSL